MIYLDYNATSPISKEVADAMRPFLEGHYGNPSSIHSYGIKAKKAVEKARMQIAQLLHCDSSEIIFTSGGTESNNYAIKGFAFAHKSLGNHIITSAIEHPAVLEVCYYLEKQGFELSVVPVDEYGKVDPSTIEKAIKPDTILISIMHANNEVGTIQDIGRIAEIAKRHKIAFHTDAAQSVGKISTDVQELGVDMLSIAGHKLYAPKGIGALYIKSGIRLEKFMHGANHEQNLRAGTENVMQIAGLGKACEIANRDMESNSLHYQKMRDMLYKGLEESIPGIKRNGSAERCLPNTLSVSFPHIEANTLVSRLENIAVSAGAACHAENIDVSTVLEAMKIPIVYAMGTIRFSTGRYNSESEIRSAVKQISRVVLSMQKIKPVNPEEEDDEKIKLTQFTHGLGCACKIRPQNLEKILKNLPIPTNPNVLVGSENADDACIYKINDEIAFVQTLDFFTPIVDDPYDFGAIAAANALSDIYAMGAKPLFALNIAAFPEDILPLSILEKILLGAADKAKEAGIEILGGHTIEDNEPKYGMVVSGIIHPDKYISNTGAMPGDVLILTKSLGSGIFSTALKRGMLDDEKEKQLIHLMSSLNKTASEIMVDFNVHACTDVTGFGLLGHLKEMSEGSKCNVSIRYNHIPILDQVLELATAGIIPGGSQSNLSYVDYLVDFNGLNTAKQIILADAQTSGGLLMAVAENESDAILKELHKRGIISARKIGVFSEKGEGRISVNR